MGTDALGFGKEMKVILHVLCWMGAVFLETSDFSANVFQDGLKQTPALGVGLLWSKLGEKTSATSLCATL